ncbi:MAG: type-F conjugative transfer system pilin assembly protein TrbC [Alphaproteobacteria bacterium]
MLSSVKLLLLLIIVVITGITSPGTTRAGDTREGGKESDFKSHLKWAKENLEATQKKIAALQQEEEKGKSSCPSNKCSLKSLQMLAGNEHKTRESQERILVFVSFSMPEASLRELTEAAEAANAVLIIRGLIQDSFKITAERIKGYAQGMELNPDLFEQYSIQHVPTFVRIKDGHEQARLSGNVTLKFAKAKLEEVS